MAEFMAVIHSGFNVIYVVSTGNQVDSFILLILNTFSSVCRILEIPVARLHQIRSERIRSVNTINSYLALGFLSVFKC